MQSAIDMHPGSLLHACQSLGHDARRCEIAAVAKAGAAVFDWKENK